MWELSNTHPLHRLFSGLTENAFFERFGIADPALTDYLSSLLSRFIHHDAVFALRNGHGRPMTELVEMVVEAENLPDGGKTKRDYFKHIGDFTLFWTGVFPEILQPKHGHADCLLNYAAQGKRSYTIAGSYVDERCKDESKLLQRIATEYDLCAVGLREVRREWEEMQPTFQTVGGIIKP